jgi:hypothetical protein
MAHAAAVPARPKPTGRRIPTGTCAAAQERPPHALRSSSCTFTVRERGDGCLPAAGRRPSTPSAPPPAACIMWAWQGEARRVLFGCPRAPRVTSLLAAMSFVLRTIRCPSLHRRPAASWASLQLRRITSATASKHIGALPVGA